MELFHSVLNHYQHLILYWYMEWKKHLALRVNFHCILPDYQAAEKANSTLLGILIVTLLNFSVEILYYFYNPMHFNSAQTNCFYKPTLTNMKVSSQALVDSFSTWDIAYLHLNNKLWQPAITATSSCTGSSTLSLMGSLFHFSYKETAFIKGSTLSKEEAFVLRN